MEAVLNKNGKVVSGKIAKIFVRVGIATTIEEKLEPIVPINVADTLIQNKANTKQLDKPKGKPKGRPAKVKK